MTVEPAKRVAEIVGTVEGSGLLTARESTTLEFKESFGFGSIAKYLRSFAAFANTEGGIILFGVGDSPRRPLGVDRKKFDEIEQEKMSTFINEHFSPYIEWTMGVVDVGGKCFGFFEAKEAAEKPVVCKKNGGDDLKDGSIYYRYRGQTRVIAYPELRRIHDEMRQKERALWMQHIERIGKIGVKNVALLDLYDGTLHADPTSRLVLSKELLEDLKKNVTFVQEGKFVETGGIPTLKVIGSVLPAGDIVTADVDLNRDYPYIQSALAEKLSVRPYDVQVLLWKLKLRGSKKFHMEVKYGESVSIHRYSESALKHLIEALPTDATRDKYLRDASKEYVTAHRKKA